MNSPRYRSCSLPEVAFFQEGPGLRTHQFSSDGMKVINVTNILLDGTVDVTNTDKFVSLTEFETRYQHFAVEENDIVVASSGNSYGKVGRIRAEHLPLMMNTSVIRFHSRNPEVLDDDYLFAFLRSTSFKGQVEAFVTGGAQPNFGPSHVKQMKISLPPLEVQRRVAETISAYDNLLQNNRRRMALLEESARLLYREWFVRLRFPGHERTEIVDGVPEGWTRKSLSDVAEFRLGKMLDQNKNKGDLMPYLANVNVRWGQFDLSDLREMRFEDDELETFGLKCGDIVMCEGGEPGRCAIWKEQMPGMMIQKAIHRIRSRVHEHHVFLYRSLRHLGESGYLATLFTGATIKHLPREKLAKVTVVIPPARLMDAFLEQAGPVERQILLLESANRRAAEARDLLLPRLMSGEISV